MCRERCDSCPHFPLCKGCPFRSLAANLDNDTTRAMLSAYCLNSEGSAQCVRRLVMRFHNLVLPADIMPDGRSCFGA